MGAMKELYTKIQLGVKLSKDEKRYIEKYCNKKLKLKEPYFLKERSIFCRSDP